MNISSQSFHLEAVSPIMIVTSLSLTIVLVGWAAVPSFVLALGFMITAQLLGKKGGAIRAMVLPHTDRRSRLINELISSIFYIKLSCYEDVFADKIFDERRQGLSVLLTSFLLTSFVHF